MEKQKNDKESTEEFIDADPQFNSRNQYSGSGDLSPDEQEKSNQKRKEDLESSLNTKDESESPMDSQQDNSDNLESNN